MVVCSQRLQRSRRGTFFPTAGGRQAARVRDVIEKVIFREDEGTGRGGFCLQCAQGQACVCVKVPDERLCRGWGGGLIR